MIVLLPAILMVPLWVNLFYIARAGVTLFVSPERKRFVFWTSLGISLALALPVVGTFMGMADWMIVIVHLILFRAITQLVNYVIKRVRNGESPRWWDRLYRLCVIPLVCVIAVYAYGYVNLRDVVETTYTVDSEKIVGDGYRVAFLSDIHFSTANDEESLAEVVAEVSAAKPDVVILGGDIVDEATSREDMQVCFKTLGNIQSRFGIFFVFGNHDRVVYSPNPPFSQTELEEAITAGGITILRDEARVLAEDLVLLGRHDRSMNPKPVEELLRGVNKEAFLLMADHQPVDFAEKEAAGIDLQMSGHTHGGQIFPIGYVNTLISTNELCYGQEQVGQMNAIVSSGVSGWGFAIRTQAPSEYVLVDIQ